MKKAETILVTILLVAMTGCVSKQSTDDLIIVDVTKSYPQKELILQDFMDVEYIPLETNDEFLTQGRVMAIGKNILLVMNRIDDGDIFVYDRNGKALRKINRKGEGGEEYLFINNIILDEENNEMFVNSVRAKKILVYDLDGKFKRSIRYPDNINYDNVHLYDKDNLICYDSSINNKEGEERGSQSYHFMISKQDGSITQEIFIPFKTINSYYIFQDEYTIAAIMSEDYSIISYHDSWALVELSSDTIYKYLPNGHLSPLIVRTPPIQSMNPPEICLLLKNITDRYYFMETFIKAFDTKTMTVPIGNNLMYDRQENAIFEYSIFNDDYSTRRVRMMNAVNEEIAFWQVLDADRLVGANKNMELKGKLKEIAATLEEDDNPVIMLVKHRK
jgi:hypothetical protein